MAALERDVVVIGAGFGGLAAALELARAGLRVTVCEQLRYPGGCASTFTRGGARFESGATLFSGFAPGQLFARWIDELALPVRFDPIDPVIELRAPGLALAVPRERAQFVEQLASLPGAPAERVRAFFREQRRVADALWALFDDPALLPPLDARALAAHALRAPHYVPVLRVIGRPLAQVLARHELEQFAPLRTWLDAVCQITVQASAAEAEAPFAMGAMDYPFRGTGHVHGGIGALASALAGAIEASGGEVRFSDRVRALRRDGYGWVIDARRGALRAREVVANLLPQDAAALLGERERAPVLDDLAREVEGGWGACMLFLELEADAPARDEAHHLELIADADAPFVEGNHLFVSISGRDEERAPGGRRTVTISTHVAIDTLRGLAPDARAGLVARVQEAMRTTLRLRAPEVAGAIAREMTGSPRTFARFTGRAEGLVGGIPRRAGWSHYRRLGPLEPVPGVHLVGDSVFPGQSTLATALGGVRVAERIARRNCVSVAS